VTKEIGREKEGDEHEYIAFPPYSFLAPFPYILTSPTVTSPQTGHDLCSCPPEQRVREILRREALEY
jgi:hypothetical protein